jgi:6-pyruvoyltetrahydropterin/6-carboxytetrahydropterin synthase
MELYASRTGWFILKLTQSFYFEAAHTLKKRHTDIHTMLKSEEIHGHTYHASISVEGEVEKNGMVKDFNAIGFMVHYVLSHLDHKFLDDVPDLGRPTMENLCLFIAEKAKQLKGLCEVTVERKASGDKCTLKIKKRIPILKAQGND